MESAFAKDNNTIHNFIRNTLYREITRPVIQNSAYSSEVEKPFRRGYYTGAFDMFHYGHLLGIQQAVNYCDELIVAVSTDEVIRDYKHREPIIPFEQRLAIVSAIKGVSIAIPQYDLYDKMGPAETLGCDVIFSSTEYQRSEYDGKEMTPKQQAGVERWEQFETQASEEGISIVYLPRTQSISSTEIKESIVEQYLQSHEEPIQDEIQPTDFKALASTTQPATIQDSAHSNRMEFIMSSLPLTDQLLNENPFSPPISEDGMSL